MNIIAIDLGKFNSMLTTVSAAQPMVVLGIRRFACELFGGYKLTGLTGPKGGDWPLLPLIL